MRNSIFGSRKNILSIFKGRFQLHGEAKILDRADRWRIQKSLTEYKGARYSDFFT